MIAGQHRPKERSKYSSFVKTPRQPEIRIRLGAGGNAIILPLGHAVMAEPWGA
jgi:hypothetical protein